jgi:hypothetical protein
MAKKNNRQIDADGHNASILRRRKRATPTLFASPSFVIDGRDDHRHGER